MAYFAVTYVYAENSAETRQDMLTQHRGYMRSLFEQHRLSASGPWIGEEPGGLFILSGNSLEDVVRAMDGDPFYQAGLVASRTFCQWDPVVGVFA